MNVMIISNLYPPHVVGGYEILCGQVASLLSSRGHRVTVLTSASPDSDEVGVAPSGAGEAGSVTVLRDLELMAPFGTTAPRSRTRRWAVGRANERATRRVLESVRPDVVFVWSQLRLSLGSSRACQRAGVPVCFTMNDPHLAGYAPRRLDPEPRAMAGSLMDRLPFRGDTTLALDLDHVTCISKVVVQDLASGGIDLPSPRVIHQGIPIERFPLKEVPGSLGTPVRLLYAGQLLDYKGPDVLIRAVGQLIGEGGHGVEVTIAGDGPFRGALESLARQLGAPAEFTGALGHDRMPEVYREHDVLAFTSTWREPFGLTHLEAMASGTPVVSTAVGGQAEFLRDGDNALVVPPGDPEALANAIRRILETPGLARSLALSGRRTVETRFTLDRYVTDLERWLLDLCTRNAN